MKCKFSTSAPSNRDKPYFIRKDVLFSCETDIDQRESNIVHDYYHQDWFDDDENGNIYFILPTFYVAMGKIFFINGRHRAVLLGRYLDIIPMAITSIHNIFDTASQIIADKIIEREIGSDEIISLPDLPIRPRPPEDGNKDNTEYFPLLNLSINFKSK